MDSKPERPLASPQDSQREHPTGQRKEEEAGAPSGPNTRVSAGLGHRGGVSTCPWRYTGQVPAGGTDSSVWKGRGGQEASGRRACDVPGRSQTQLAQPEAPGRRHRYRTGPALQGGRQPEQLAPRRLLVSGKCSQKPPVRLRTGHGLPPSEQNLSLLGTATVKFGAEVPF